MALEASADQVVLVAKPARDACSDAEFNSSRADFDGAR